MKILYGTTNPLENARIKALAYYKAAKMPVFSCDSGLYIEGLSEEEQPGVHVRRVNGKILNDEEMIDYYSKLSVKLGGKFIIASKPHLKKHIGFPLDSLSVHIKSGKYYMDIDYNSDEDEYNVAKSYRIFFAKSLFGGKI